MNRGSIPTRLAWSLGGVVAMTSCLWAQSEGRPGADPAEGPEQFARARLERDFTEMGRFRPAYRFWRHIFTVADDSIAFGSGVDGRLLATFPLNGHWPRDAAWVDPSVAGVFRERAFADNLSERRDEVARLLELSVGPVVHNATRGLFLLPNARRFGDFLSDWGAIYERFGVPAEIGLAQAIVESGLNATVRSEARAVGFCQWLLPNWNRLKALAPHVLEGHNQTTQAPYCAAYLSILATKYGSFIPALSEHHAAGARESVLASPRSGARSRRGVLASFRGSRVHRPIARIHPTRRAD